MEIGCLVSVFTWDRAQHSIGGERATGGLGRSREQVLPASVDEWEASVDGGDDHHVDEAAQDGHPSPAAVRGAVGNKLERNQTCIH